MPPGKSVSVASKEFSATVSALESAVTDASQVLQWKDLAPAPKPQVRYLGGVRTTCSCEVGPQMTGKKMGCK